MARFTLDELNEDVSAPSGTPEQASRFTIDDIESSLSGGRKRAEASESERTPGVDRSMGRLGSAGGSFMRGAGQTVAGIPKGIALVSAPDPATWENLDRIDAGKDPVPETQSPGGTAGAFGIEAEVGNELYRQYQDASPEGRREIRDALNERARAATSESDIYQVGNEIDAWFRENFPTNPEFQDEFWTSKAPQGVGSGVSFLLASALSHGALRPLGRRAQNIGTYAAPAGMGSGLNSAQLFEDALAEGADVSTALEAAGWGRVWGLSEAVPIGNLFNRMDRLGGGQIRRYISRAMRQGTEEAVQEAFVGILNDATAQGLYDPERGVWDLEARGEEAAVGFTTGAILETLMTLAIPGRRRGAGAQTDESGVPDGAVPGETIIGREEPAGEREKARAETPPPMPGDVESPLQTETIQAGKEAIQDAMGEQSASQILEGAGFPEVNSRINLTTDDGTQVSGMVVDAFEEGGVQGAKIQLDDGTIISETFDALRGRVTPTEEDMGGVEGVPEDTTLGAEAQTPEQDVVQPGQQKRPDGGQGAETVRGDTRPVEGAGTQRPGGEVEGRPDLQRPAQERPAAGDRQAPQAPEGRRFVEPEEGVTGALPEGWTESQPGGMATGPNREIVDQNIASGKWFAIPAREGEESIEGFDTREEAIAAIQGRESTETETPAETPTEATRAPISRRDVEGDQGSDTAVTSTGREVPVRYAVVEASELVSSQRDDGRVNPDYPAELQPRDRARAVSAQQIKDIAQGLNPRLLDRSPRAADGAPIVDAGGIVESGNGRILAIRRAYQQGLDTAEQYRAYLAEQGYPVDGLRQPVLVRVREGEMDPSERAAFTREANERDTLGMSATERAMADATAMNDNLLDLYEGGDVDMAGNRPFVRAFLNQIVGRNEQADMVKADGSMSPGAVRRIEAALFAKAYGDVDLVSSLIESLDNNIKAIGGALMDVAAAWAQMRADAQSGQINADMDQTEHLLGAVRLIQRARRERRSISEFVGQRDILSGEAIDPMAELFLTLMFRNLTNWTQPAGRDKIREGLSYYIDQARRAQPGVDLLGEEAPDPGRILTAARERQYGTEAEQEAQQDLLARPAGSDVESEPAARPGGEERPASGRADEVQPEGERDRPAGSTLTDQDVSEEAVRARRRRDKAFKAAYVNIGDPHPEGVGQQFLRGWMDAEAGRTMDESQVGKPTEEMSPSGFNPIDYYRSGYVSQRGGEPVSLRVLDDTPETGGGPGRQLVSAEDARAEIEAAGGTITSTGTRQASRPGEDEAVETEFFRVELRQADGMPVVMDNVSFPVLRMDLDRWLEIPNRTGSPAGLASLAGGRPQQQPPAGDEGQKIPEPQWWKDLTGAQRSNRLDAAGIRGTARTPWSRLTAEQQRNLDQQWGPDAEGRRDQEQRDIYAIRAEEIEDIDEIRGFFNELRTQVLTDERTGLGSNRAWINRTPKAYIASIDLDNLKWVNDNMGHDAGDRMIEVVGDAMREAGIADDAFHVSGDEFYAHSEDEQRLRDAMDQALEYLRGVTIEGNGLQFRGPAFSYGIGTSIEQAEVSLNDEKSTREEAGERAARGERPRGVSARPEEGQPQETAAGDQEAPEDRPSEPAERPEPRVAPDTDPEMRRLADHFARAFADDRSFRSITEARREAGQFLNRTIEPGTQDAKRVDEAIELGVVMRARAIAAEESANPQQAYGRLVDLYGRMPNLSTRTSTSVAQQAYSTPIPLGYLAARAAGITNQTRIYEPSAGNGSLLVTANPDNVLANELNPERAANLDAILPSATVTRNDAAEWSPDGQYDVVIANPPFGPVKDDQGRSRRFQVDDRYETTEIDHAISMRALEAMADDGSAVLIVGSVAKTARSEDARSDAYNGKAKREFYLTLYGEYNVVDHFTVAGELYEKQGAGWPVDVIVIRGRGPSDRRVPAADPPRVYESWDDLGEVLDAEYPQAQAQPGATDRGGDRGQRRPASGDGRDRGSGGRARPDRQQRPAEEGQPGRVRPGPVDGQPTDTRPAEPGQRATQDRPDQRDGTARRPRRDPVKVAGENARQVSYQPSSTTTSMGTLVPVNMQTAVGNALDGLRERVGDIDTFVASRLGYEPGEIGQYFGAEQIDALALAIDNMENGSGFIIGDQTGIGKGRVVAGVIRHALRQGLTPIFVTERANLYGDMYRDMNDIGISKMLGHDPNILMTNASETVPLDESGKSKIKTPAAKTHNAALQSMAADNNIGGYDMVFTTYSQMQTRGGERTARMDFLEAIGRGAIVIFDESHNAGGTQQTGRDGQAVDEGQEQINRATFARQLARSAQGVLYSSATYAKRPEVMDLYATTDMRLAVSDIKDLADAIQKGGVPMQQVVASMLSQSGQYLRRERSFDGIAYNAPVVSVPRETYGGYSRALNAIQQFSERHIKDAVKNIDKDLKAQGKQVSGDGSTGGAGASSTHFTSIMHNLIDQMLLAIKADPAADRAIEAIRNGEKPVITLSNTMGSFINDFAEEVGAHPGDRMEIDFNSMLERYLDRTRRITIKQPFSKKGETGEHYYLTDSDLGSSAVKAFEAAREQIRNLDLSSLPISPIDHIIKRIKDAGYSVGEITGRPDALDYRGDGVYFRRRPGSERSITGRRKFISDFNSGKLDAMIINQAGSTGLSLHASETFKDQRKRRMILAQPEKNIDTHMQMLGRVHRTGQVIEPEYDQLVADVPAEKRPAAVLAKKMASLNANTTASRGGALQAENVPDFMNEYGDEVAARIMADIPEIHKALGSPLKEGTDGFDPTNAMRIVTGRIPLLPIEQQEDIYEALESEYNALIEQKEAAGESVLEAKTLELDADIQDRRQVVAPESGDSPFADGVYVETADVKRLGKPHPTDRVIEMAAESVEIDASSVSPDNMKPLQDAGREQARQMLSDTRQSFQAYRREAIEELESDAARKNTESRLDAQMNRLRAVLERAPVGQSVRLTAESGTLYGVVTRIARTGRAKSPVALGSWKVTVAVTDASRQLTIPVSQLYTPSNAPSSGENHLVVEPAERLLEGMPVIRAFDEMQAELRETRTIITGNLLTGFDHVGGRGAIVNFTDREGGVRQGILMPRDYEYDKQQQERPVDFRSAEQVIEFVERGNKAQSSDRAIEVSQSGEKIRVEVVGARSRGGRYYLDRGVLQAAGQEFVKVGTRMRMDVDPDVAASVLDNLKRVGAGFRATDNLKAAREIVGNVSSAEEVPKEAWLNMIDDAEGRGDDNISEPEPLYSGYGAADDIQGGQGDADSVAESRPDAAPAQLGLFDRESLGTETADEQARDSFEVAYRQVEVGRIPSGISRAESAEDAAHILAPIRKHAQETFMALVTDADNNVLNIIRHTKGTRDAASIDPSIVAGAIAATDGASNVWFAHNHPSGVTQASRPDVLITEKLVGTLDGLDVNFRGHLIFGAGGKVSWFSTEVGQEDVEPTRRPRRTSLAITERMIRRQPRGERVALTTSAATENFAKSLESSNAVILLDHRHHIAGVLSMTAQEMGALRENGRVARILRGIDQSNAGTAVIVSESPEAARNVARFLNNLEMRVLDAIIMDGGRSTSSASRGLDIEQDRGYFYSLRDDGDDNVVPFRRRERGAGPPTGADLEGQETGPEPVTMTEELSSIIQEGRRAYTHWQRLDRQWQTAIGNAGSLSRFMNDPANDAMRKQMEQASDRVIELKDQAVEHVEPGYYDRGLGETLDPGTAMFAPDGDPLAELNAVRQVAWDADNDGTYSMPSGARASIDDLPIEAREDVVTALLERVPAATSAYREQHGREPTEEDLRGELFGLADPLTFPRVSVSPERVSARRATSDTAVGNYASRMAAGETPPPVLVRRLGRGYALVEGGNRLAAAKRAGLREIPAIDVSDLYGMDWSAFFAGEEAVDGAPLTSQIDLQPDFAEQADAIGDDLQQRLKGLGISGQVGLRLRQRIHALANGRASAADGRYFRRVIEISMEARDPQATLNHEVIHALRDLGLIRGAEWRTLERAARADTDRMKGVRRRYERLGLSEDAMVEEAVANMYADWSAARSEAGGFMRRAFERIRDFLRALGQVLRGRGFATRDSVFRSVERGEVGRRGRRDARGRFTADTSTVRDPGPRFALSDPQANDPTAKDGTVARQKATNQWLGFQPLDQAFRVPFHVFGGINEHGEWKWGKTLHKRAEQTIVNAKFSEDGRFHWINPTLEAARAGLIDRYGLDPAYVERDRQRGLEQSRLMLQAEEHMRVLKEAHVGPEEAKALQAMLTREEVPDEDAAHRLMAEGIPEPIRNAIDDMGQEAVNLGLISAESFERNRGAYLHRVYLKHETDQGGLSRFVERMGSRRRKKIIGNQFKGRGLWIEVNRDRLMRNIPGFRQAERGGAVVGERFRVLDKVEHEGQGTLRDIDPASQRKVLDRIYLPEDAEVPDRLGDYVDRGIWEVRGTQGGNMVLWRDFTKAEREQMGEIVDARYTIAKTYMVMAHDLATGRFFRDIAMNEDWARSSEPRVGTWKDAQEYNHFWADPSIEWVRVPDTVIPKSRTKRYGALSGKWVRSEIWRDLHELENMQKANWWNTLLTQWKLNKALALDTPIPTPGGWTTMGEIQVGDRVFDEKGQPCTVLEVKEVQHERPCYEVAFSDGTKIVADDEHWWFVVGRNNAKGKVLTTAEIKETLIGASRGDRNHSIPVTDALELPEADLPLPPYALGLWVGDGHSESPRITVGSTVIDEVEERLREVGVSCGTRRHDPRSSAITFTIDVQPVCAGSSPNLFKEALQDLGVLGDKRLPGTYLRASIEQRFALLRGLMDADGWVTDRGTCGFATSIESLRDGVLELLRSLGFKPTVSEINPEAGKTAWRIHFQAYADTPVVTVQEKASRLRERPETRQRSKTRQIVSIEPVQSVPVRCIAVSSESRLYLAGEGMVPTHNTARSPVVHMNNVMSNVVLMDLADVRAIDLVQGIVSMVRQDQSYQDARDHGAFGADMVSQEIRKNVLQPILEEIQRDVQGGQDTIESKIGTVGKLADAIWSRTKGLDRKMVDLYRLEDEVFRMATYKRKLSLGIEPNQAALEARDQFLNYDIRAPWINAARRSVLPFISYTYRAVPKVAESLALRPWKLAKMATIAYAVSSLGYMLEPGDEDEERRSMREHETGYTWLGAPRMIRMPYSDEYGNPVFLDVRRWVPAGDVFDMNQGHSAIPIPAPLQFGGPLMLGAELALNKRSFTGDEIVNDRTDDWWDKTAAVADWGWKSWMPSAAWIPGSWYWERIGNAATGGRDWQGRPYSLREAIPSSFGIKLKPQDVQENMFWKGIEFDRVERELKAELRRAHRDYERNLISGSDLEKQEQNVMRKLENLARERQRTFEGIER